MKKIEKHQKNPRNIKVQQTIRNTQSAESYAWL